METADNRWGIERVTDVSVDGDEWVIYSDGSRQYAVMLEDWHTELDDYSVWCSESRCAGDAELCRHIALAAGMVGLHAGGTTDWVGV